MTDLSREIFEKWQVRKTKAQKGAFIDFLRSRLPELRVEEGGRPKSRNLVLGDLNRAKVILTAHYDTCARVPFPNFVTPKNFLVYILYNLAIVAPFLALMFLVALPLSLVLEGQWPFAVGWLVMMVTMFWVLMGGKPNEHTANDNTSGVITLLEIYAAMTPQQREKTCFVFFDNEESGLLGSKFYAKRHKEDGLKEKFLLNFDCVSDGDTFLIVHNKPAGKRYGATLEEVFQSGNGKTVELCSSAKAFYPSDQANFPVNAAVSAMNRSKLVGLYMNKIHTKHDTVFQEENIRFLKDAAIRLTDRF